MTLSIEAIVENGLCIGCGLCRAVAGEDRIDIVLTPEGRERPLARMPLDDATLDRINAVCPGTRVGGARAGSQGPGAQLDLVWGPAERLAIGYAADPGVRFRGSTGGLLTALGQHLLDSGTVDFILHVGASASDPVRTDRKLSFDAAAVLEGAGSRYAPVATLVDFTAILDRGRPFALIAKPCDVTAVRNLARLDERVDRLMRYALTFVCGGASDLTKSEAFIERFGVARDEVASLRYRGHGTPGMNRIETRDGRAFELTYREMWEEESKWMIQPRCKICPDAIGEGADIVACDVWPGGGPTGEDPGYNGIIVRTRSGLDLFDGALAAGAIRVEPDALGFRDLDRVQPHHVRKKCAAWARMAGMKAAGLPVFETHDLRLEDCARTNSVARNLAEARGTRRRARTGTLGEPPVTERPRSPERERFRTSRAD